MSLSTTELDSLRFHLGYGNISVGAEPYTPDTFYEVFNSVVSPYLSTGTETSATTAVTAGATTTVTPASMTGISAYTQLVIDVAEQAEVVMVKAVTATTFTAYFTKAHAASGYPIATLAGVGRLRILLHQADAAWQATLSPEVGATAGLKQVDKGDVEWFQGFQVLSGRLDHYKAIVASISSLVRVQPAWGSATSRRSGRLEAY
jgi:hypothetical protein